MLHKAVHHPRVVQPLIGQLGNRGRLRFVQHRVQRIHHPLALDGGQLRQPAVQRFIHKLPLSGQAVHTHEVIPQHIPRKGTVLHNAGFVAVHHGVLLFVLQQHTDHR